MTIRLTAFQLLRPLGDNDFVRRRNNQPCILLLIPEQMCCLARIHLSNGWQSGPDPVCAYTKKILLGKRIEFTQNSKFSHRRLVVFPVRWNKKRQLFLWEHNFKTRTRWGAIFRMVYDKRPPYCIPVGQLSLSTQRSGPKSSRLFMMWSYPNVYSAAVLLPLEKLGNLFHIWSYFKFNQYHLTHLYTKELYGGDKTPQFSYQGEVNTATGSFFHIHEFVRNYHHANLKKISSTIGFHCGCARLLSRLNHQIGQFDYNKIREEFFLSCIV